MGFSGNLRKAGGAGVKTLVESNPVTKAISGTLNALGIGGYHNRRGEAIARLKKDIAAGNWEAVQRAANNAKYGRKRAIAQAALELGSTDPEAARQRFLAKKAGAVWPAQNGPAPDAVRYSAKGSRPVSRSPIPSPSAPPAGKQAARARKSSGPSALPTARPKPPCKYGARGPDGYCPKRQARPRALATPRAQRPCAYGPRGPDGLCPKRKRATAAQTATSRAVTKAATAAGTAAASTARTVLKTVGPGAVVSTVAKASLVLGAGLAAYYLTSQLMKLRYKTYNDLRNDASDAYRHARQQAAAQLGRGLTPQENAEFSRYYKARIALLNAYEAAGKPISGVANLTFED